MLTDLLIGTMKRSTLATALLSLILSMDLTLAADKCAVACEDSCTELPKKLHMYQIMPTPYSSGGQWEQHDGANGYMAQANLFDNILTLQQIRVPGTSPIVPATYLYQLIYENGKKPQWWWLKAGDQCTTDLSNGIKEVHLWVGIP
jgi:hypothetical protein